MTCILVMAKNENPNSWIFSARGDCDALKKLQCYQDPPLGDVPKAGNPATLVATVTIPNCDGLGPSEAGTIYSLQNG